ncbi:MAG: hypothetical protein JW716_04635 [Candidatus Aenigmarchaeota archaeon]|nr:hypothetical protein [Candidatus Aenigmarchaeota archaeon]
MVERKISKQRYIAATVITTFIFIFGVLLGLVLDYERVEYLQFEYSKNELDYKSLQMQFSLLDMEEEDMKGCAAFEKVMESTVSELADSLEAVQTYREYSATKKDQYDIIERRYALDNLRYWMIVKRAQKICPMNKLTVLYFFSLDNCPVCPNQGVILTYFKKKFDDKLLIFPINTDISEKEPMLDVIQSRYNITSYPSIVIGDDTYNGILDKDALGSIICSKLNVSEGECS